jgi:hypothetical protein
MVLFIGANAIITASSSGDFKESAPSVNGCIVRQSRGFLSRRVLAPGPEHQRPFDAAGTLVRADGFGGGGGAVRLQAFILAVGGRSRLLARP